MSIPPRMYQVPGSALLAGTLIGAVRGSRKESLRFLAENAHRAPKTVQGWYFYNKTKNYKIILAGLREGGRDAARLGVTALGWVTIEEGMKRIGMPDAAEIGAGIGTGAIFGGVCTSSLQLFSCYFWDSQRTRQPRTAHNRPWDVSGAVDWAECVWSAQRPGRAGEDAAG